MKSMFNFCVVLVRSYLFGEISQFCEKYLLPDFDQPKDDPRMKTHNWTEQKKNSPSSS